MCTTEMFGIIMIFVIYLKEVYAYQGLKRSFHKITQIVFSIFYYNLKCYAFTSVFSVILPFRNHFNALI